MLKSKNVRHLFDYVNLKYINLKKHNTMKIDWNEKKFDLMELTLNQITMFLLGIIAGIILSIKTTH